MRETNVTVEAFTKAEKAKIQKIKTELLRNNRYGGMATLYHDLVMHGCKTFLTDEKE